MITYCIISGKLGLLWHPCDTPQDNTLSHNITSSFIKTVVIVRYYTYQARSDNWTICVITVWWLASQVASPLRRAHLGGGIIMHDIHMLSHDTACYRMLWYSMVWYRVVCIVWHVNCSRVILYHKCGMVQYGTIWYNIVPSRSPHAPPRQHVTMMSEVMMTPGWIGYWGMIGWLKHLIGCKLVAWGQ